MGVIDYNLAFKQIAPSYFDSARKGIELGNTIRNAPILRKLNEQRAELNEQNAALNEQKLTEGNINTGESEAMAIFRLTGNKPITPENYLANIQSFKRAGLPVQQQDLEVTPENIAAFEQLRQYGQNVAGSKTPKGLASAKTTQYKNGAAVLILPDGTRRVIAPNGQEVTDPDQQVQIINDANESGIILAGQEAFSKSSSTSKGKREQDREQDIIADGMSAASGLYDIERGLDLLGKVRTGGYAANQKAVTDYFGTTSGDVGELNNILAQNVLEGLKNFTGAISEGERKFVEQISASLKAGNQVNERQLLRMKRSYDNAVRKSVKLAKKNEDYATLESIKVDLGQSALAKELFPNSFKSETNNTTTGTGGRSGNVNKGLTPEQQQRLNQLREQQR